MRQAEIVSTIGLSRVLSRAFNCHSVESLMPTDIQEDDIVNGRSLCVYCGLVPATTKDHVIPRCLFTNPLPNNMVTVPVCEKCNNEKSKNDSYLRDILVVDIRCSEHPLAQKLMHETFIRSVRSNRSEIGRATVSRRRTSPLYTSGGLYLGHYPSIPIDSERLNDIFRTMIRGLYYKARRCRLPDNYLFQIRQTDPLHFRGHCEMAMRSDANGTYELGYVFGCIYYTGMLDHGETHWLLSFFNGFFVEVHTHHPLASPFGKPVLSNT